MNVRTKRRVAVAPEGAPDGGAAVAAHPGSGGGPGRHLVRVLRFPFLAWLIRDRRVAAAFVLTGLFFGGLAALGIKAFVCPIRAVFGIQCPGCGVTRGSLALLRGDWGQALAFHAFTPVFLAGAVLLAVGVAVPPGARDRLADLVESVERRTGMTMILLVAAAIYGLTRNLVSG